MRRDLLALLQCPWCGGAFAVQVLQLVGETIHEAVLRCRCDRNFPVIKGVPRILPPALASTLNQSYPEFFARYPELSPTSVPEEAPESVRTLRTFGDEWQRFPELREAHERIFHWYFEGPEPMRWPNLLALDAGCGMGRWLHFARKEGASVIGMDVSPAIDVAAAREGTSAHFVQADLRYPPFAARTFQLVYSLGVLHHLEAPEAGVAALARLVGPGGELRIYVYRTLTEEGVFRRALLGAVTVVRKGTTRLPFSLLHAFSSAVAAIAFVAFITPRRIARAFGGTGERLTRRLPLAQYADIPFGMLVAEQFDRFGAPIEGRHTRDEVVGWLERAGLEVLAVLPELGWRGIGRCP